MENLFIRWWLPSASILALSAMAESDDLIANRVSETRYGGVGPPGWGDLLQGLPRKRKIEPQSRLHYIKEGGLSSIFDDFVKSPDAALRGILCRCGVRPSTPHSSGFARLACGAFYEVVESE